MTQPNTALTIDLGTLLYGGCDADGHPIGDPMLARRHLLRLGIGRSSADFLARAIWWWLQVGRRDFYKFNVPCLHPNYRPGDSWSEELCFSWSTLRQARAAVATKIRRGDSKKEILARRTLASLLLYWQRPDNRTCYELNEALLCSLLSEVLGIQVVMPGVPACSTPYRSVSREGATSILDDPRPGRSYARSSSSYPQIHQPLSDDTPISSDKDRPMGNTPYSSKQQLKEEENKDGEFIRLIALGLEGEGVFSAPALEIAQKAYYEGLDLDAVLELFWAHKAHAASSRRVRDPIAAATQRLRRGQLEPPHSRKENVAAAEFFRVMGSTGEGGTKPTLSPNAALPSGQDSCSHETLHTWEPPALDTPDGPSPIQDDTHGKKLSPVWWEPTRQHLRGQMTQATYDYLLVSSEVWEDDDGTLLLLARDTGAAAHLQRWERRIRDAIYLSGGGRNRGLFIAQR